MKNKSSASALALSVLVLAVPSAAAVGLDASGAQDTVLKVEYTGGSPSSATHPTVHVSGKTIGIKSVANNTSGANGARGIMGVVSGFTPPATSTDIGVVGAGGIGVYGVSTWASGVRGYGPVGMYAEGTYAGIHAVSGEDAGYFDGNVYVSGTITEGSD